MSPGSPGSPGSSGRLRAVDDDRAERYHHLFMGWLRRSRGGGDRGPADLITGVIGPQADGWKVTWAGDGASPPGLRAPSLSAVAEQASAAVARLYAGLPPNPAAELQLAICPWPYRDGPMFDVSAAPGGFSAQDLTNSFPAVHGASLEDLVAAVELMPGAGPGHCMLRWIRPVSALPAGRPPSPGQ